ncbi:MAG: thiamine phosphate synthase, partial [Muribaculaceae bacterium]|nr:thiamine phosphate synthase [Muribaculaceae bacterium]
MLQFITHPSERYSISEEVKMVIEGGCRWVQLRMKNATDQDVKTIAEEIIPLCQESETILVIGDRVELTMELKVH